MKDCMKYKVTHIILYIVTLFAVLPCMCQVKYQPEMAVYIGDWISHSRAGSITDKMMIRIKKRGDYVTVSMKTYPAQRWVDDGFTTEGPHYVAIENLSFSNNSFHWNFERSDDYFYYYSLQYLEGTLVYVEKWWHNNKQLVNSSAAFIPYDADW